MSTHNNICFNIEKKYCTLSDPNIEKSTDLKCKREEEKNVKLREKKGSDDVILIFCPIL